VINCEYSENKSNKMTCQYAKRGQPETQCTTDSNDVGHRVGHGLGPSMGWVGLGGDLTV